MYSKWGKKKKEKDSDNRDMRAVYVRIEVSLPRHVTRHVAPCDRIDFHQVLLSLSLARFSLFVRFHSLLPDFTRYNNNNKNELTGLNRILRLLF